MQGVEASELKVVRYEVDRGVALVTLHRPERLNAWTGRMHTEYRWCLATAERDAEVRAVVVTGAGRGFCAGADTAALDGHVRAGRYDPGTPDELARPGYGVRPEYDHPFAFHFGMRLPVIAAINGPAAGVGLVLACFCDVRFAAAGAKLTTSAGRLGLPAEYGLSWVLPRLVGIGHAADLLISSRLVDAEEAATMGLVNRVLPHDELLPAALAYAREIATSISPASARAAKAQLYADLHGDVGFAVSRSEALLEQMVRAPDFAEGVAAWQERRTPSWPGPQGDR
jgi:enoyl-CoA hydratase/carnithine racemase